MVWSGNRRWRWINNIRGSTRTKGVGCWPGGECYPSTMPQKAIGAAFRTSPSTRFRMSCEISVRGSQWHSKRGMQLLRCGIEFEMFHFLVMIARASRWRTLAVGMTRQWMIRIVMSDVPRGLKESHFASNNFFWRYCSHLFVTSNSGDGIFSWAIRSSKDG